MSRLLTQGEVGRSADALRAMWAAYPAQKYKVGNDLFCKSFWYDAISANQTIKGTMCFDLAELEQSICDDASCPTFSDWLDADKHSFAAEITGDTNKILDLSLKLSIIKQKRTNVWSWRRTKSGC